jgi:hypothetical protein
VAHPMKSDAANAHNAKLRSMTTHYGLASGPANNITTPGERLKGEEGETNVGFGADSAAASAKRGDRPARRAMAANPVPTYAKGGSVKKRDTGGDVSPIEEANKDQALTCKATGGVVARARGGRTKGKKGATHVNVIVAPQGGQPPMAGPSPQLAGLAGMKPPMAPPMAPPPGAGAPPPMMPPGAGAPPGGPPMPPGMMPRAKGGKVVMGEHPDAKQDKALIEKTLREEGLCRKARGGGLHMEAGAITGLGSLEKMHLDPPLHKDGMKPQEV